MLQPFLLNSSTVLSCRLLTKHLNSPVTSVIFCLEKIMWPVSASQLYVQATVCKKDVLAVSDKDIQSTKDLKNKLQAVYNYVHKLMCSCASSTLVPWRIWVWQRWGHGLRWWNWKVDKNLWLPVHWPSKWRGKTFFIQLRIILSGASSGKFPRTNFFLFVLKFKCHDIELHLSGSTKCNSNVHATAFRDSVACFGLHGAVSLTFRQLL